MSTVILCGSEIWPVKEVNIIGLKRNDSRIRAEDDTAVALRNRLQLSTVRECLQNRRLLWFGRLERMEESYWYSKCQKFKVGGSLAKGQPRK